MVDSARDQENVKYYSFPFSSLTNEFIQYDRNYYLPPRFTLKLD